MLCANKNDLEDQRVVDKAKAEEEAKKLGLIHMETSAKTGHNINEAFKALVRETVRTSFEYKVRHAQESYGGTALHTIRELNMDGRSYSGLKSDLSGQPLIGQGLLLLCYSALEKCISCSDATDTQYIARKM